MNFLTKKDKFGGGNKLLQYLNSKHILYAARRDSDNTEVIIGKSGFVSYNGSTVSIICNGKKVFFCQDREIKAALFQSGDGAVLSGVNGLTGRDETVIAYFTSPIKYNR